MGQWAKEHPAEHRKHQAEYRQRHLLKVRKLDSLSKKRRRKEDPQSYRQRGILATHRRRARLKGGGSYTQVEWEQLCCKYEKRCLRCGKKRRLTPDHVIPISKGGRNTIDNIQPLCQPCNSIKGAKTEDYRLRRRKRYGCNNVNPCTPWRP